MDWMTERRERWANARLDCTGVAVCELTHYVDADGRGENFCEMCGVSCVFVGK